MNLLQQESTGLFVGMPTLLISSNSANLRHCFSTNELDELLVSSEAGHKVRDIRDHNSISVGQMRQWVELSFTSACICYASQFRKTRKALLE